MLADAGIVDAARGAALARLVGGRPGAALAMGANADAVLSQARVARLLIDLLGTDRRRRMGAQADLLEDGALLDRASSGGPANDDDEPAAEAEGGKRPRGRRGGERTTRRASPAERRAAVGQVLAVWRDVARDLAVAARGGQRELRQHELLDELTDAGAAIDGQAMAVFLNRLEAIGRGLDAYANPELALDVLLLEWPTTISAAA